MNQSSCFYISNIRKFFLLLSIILCSFILFACENGDEIIIDDDNESIFIPEITLECESLVFTAIGGEKHVKINANIEYDIKTEEDWLSITKTKTGIQVSVQEFYELEKHKGNIVIYNLYHKVSKNLTIIQDPIDEKCVIYYSSNDNSIVTPYSISAFDAKIISNTYERGRGLLLFDTPISSIGNLAFYKCNNLKSITIPENVISINSTAFRSCSGLTAFYGKFASADNRCLIIDGDLLAFAPAGLTEYAIPNNIYSIGNNAFYGCNNLVSITIPDSAISIGNCAFYGCSNLKNITIPNSIAEIGQSVFGGCEQLPIIDNIRYADTYLIEAVDNSCINYNIQDFTRFIGNEAFKNCENLVNITIPHNVIDIGFLAFDNCVNLKEVVIGKSVISIGSGCFSNCKHLTKFEGKYASDDHRCLIINGELCYFAPAGLKEYTIPSNVTTIGAKAFFCSDLINITIPNGVTSIGNGAFYGCSNLISITIPISAISIAASAFKYCKNIREISIPDNVISIKDSAFYGCLELTILTIGKNVEEIGSSAFYGCSKLTTIYCKPTIPPAVYYYCEYDFSFPKNKVMNIYVPRNSYESYIQYSSYLSHCTAQTNWSQYKKYIRPYDF